MKEKILSLCYVVMAAACLGGPSVGEAVTPPEVVVCCLGYPGSAAIFSSTSPSPSVAYVTVRNSPFGVAITPDGTEALVCNNYSSSGYPSTVSVIDLASHTVVATIVVGTACVGIAITPDGKEAWVTNFGVNSVSVINIASRSVVAAVHVGHNPAYLAITPDGTQAWVCNDNDNTITIIDTLSRTPVGPPLSVGVGPFSIAMTPDGTQAWVTSIGSSTVSVVETASPHGVTTITVGTHPSSISISPDGTRAWVADSALPNNKVFVIDVRSQTVTGTVTGSVGNTLAFAPNGTEVWLVEGASLRKYNSFSQALLETVPIPRSLTNLAITPDQAPTARFTETTNGVVASFDASASSSPYGTVASYSWNFGDGTPQQTVTVPQISHTYADTNTFTVTLTVTNTQGTSTTQTFTGQTVSNNGGPSAKTSQQVSITTQFAPSTFCGKPTVHKKAKKLHLKTKWRRSSSPTVSRYIIFAYKKQRDTISATHDPKFTLKLYPQKFPHKRLSKKYKHYLENKYSIRAVNGYGIESAATKIHVRRKISGYPQTS